MRISGGTNKGRLTTSKGFFIQKSQKQKIRPTSTKVREALFDILRNHIRGARFADLYAGTGSVGLEALSRGCSETTFVENDQFLINALRNNVRKLGYEHRVHIAEVQVQRFLEKASEKNRMFDIIFLDPPYQSDEIENVLPVIEQGTFVNDEGIVVVEHFYKKKVPDMLDILNVYRDYRYGDTMLTLYKKKCL
jgi:16S rRNA (guanine(966)-N(2))-methyltransferase RsmD